MTERKPVALLFTGGMDSWVAYHRLQRSNIVKAIYVNLGHRYAQQELQAIQRLAVGYGGPKLVEVVDAPFVGQWEEENANIPGRNLLLLWVAAQYADQLCLVVQRGEMYTEDRTPFFFNLAERALSTAFGHEKRIILPFTDMTKGDMAKWYLEHDGSKEALFNLKSCFSPVYLHCGECAACFRYWIALEYAGIDLDGEVGKALFQRHPAQWSGVQDYIKKLDTYEERRREQTKEVLHKYGLM